MVSGNTKDTQNPCLDLEWLKQYLANLSKTVGTREIVFFIHLKLAICVNKTSFK